MRFLIHFRHFHVEKEIKRKFHRLVKIRLLLVNLNIGLKLCSSIDFEQSDRIKCILLKRERDILWGTVIKERSKEERIGKIKRK